MKHESLNAKTVWFQRGLVPPLSERFTFRFVSFSVAFLYFLFLLVILICLANIPVI